MRRRDAAARASPRPQRLPHRPGLPPPGALGPVAIGYQRAAPIGTRGSQIPPPLEDQRLPPRTRGWPSCSRGAGRSELLAPRSPWRAVDRRSQAPPARRRQGSNTGPEVGGYGIQRAEYRSRTPEARTEDPSGSQRASETPPRSWVDCLPGKPGSAPLLAKGLPQTARQLRAAALPRRRRRRSIPARWDGRRREAETPDMKSPGSWRRWARTDTGLPSAQSGE